MSRQAVYEVAQPFHKNGREILYETGTRFPLSFVLPDGIVVREVVVDVPDVPAAAPEPKADPAPPARTAPAGKTGRA